jgi:hypothetical protein
MTVAHDISHRVVQAMIWVYKSGLTAPETFAYPLAAERRDMAPADAGNTDAPPAGGGSAG